VVLVAVEQVAHGLVEQVAVVDTLEDLVHGGHPLAVALVHITMEPTRATQKFLVAVTVKFQSRDYSKEEHKCLLT
jgi:hypothetical protein